MFLFNLFTHYLNKIYLLISSITQYCCLYTPQIFSSRQLLTPKNNLNVQVAAARSEELPQGLVHLTSTQALEPASDVCQNVVELLTNLHMVIKQILDDKPVLNMILNHTQLPPPSIEVDNDLEYKIAIQSWITGVGVSSFTTSVGQPVHPVLCIKYSLLTSLTYASKSQLLIYQPS
jgi:hypothetical protein